MKYLFLIVASINLGLLVNHILNKREEHLRIGYGIQTIHIILLALTAFMLSGCAPEVIEGPAGPPGKDGANGSSCTVSRIEGGAIVACENGSVVVINDGADGADGVDAIVEVVDPCGPQHASGLDEVLFRTSTGELLAYFERGGSRFLTVLPPGTYQTTDGTSCVFTVNSNGEVTP